MKDCTVYLDDELLIDNGNYVNPEMIAQVEQRVQL